MKKLTIGVDFDGTLVTENFPGIGELKQETVDFVKNAYKMGHTIIIWTARNGTPAIEACEFLIDNNIPFHHFNEFPKTQWTEEGEKGRKIFCDIYLDDRAININDLYRAEHMVAQPVYKAVDKITAVTLDDISHCGQVLIEGGQEVEILKVLENNGLVIIDLSTLVSATVDKRMVSLPLGLI